MELTAKNLKKSIRNDIDDLEGTWAYLDAAIDERIKEIEADKKAGISPIPIIEFDAIGNNSEIINIEIIKIEVASSLKMFSS